MANTDIIDVINLNILDMLVLDPECPLNLHIVDSDQMGIDKIPSIMKDQPSTSVFGIAEARMRHKIAFNHNLSIDRFSFIRENRSDLINVIPNGSSLILWDYLNLSQPLSRNLIYRQWDQVDLIIILRNLIAPGGVQNIQLHNLVMP